MTTPPPAAKPRKGFGWIGVVIIILLVIALLVGAFISFILPKLLPSNCDPANVVSQHLIDSGFAEGTFIVNPTVEITGADAASERGDGAFSQDGVYTGEALAAFLSSTDPRAAQAQVVVNERLGDREVNWVPVYFTQSVNIEGNLGVENGAVIDFGTLKSGAGELVWFPVDKADCTVVEGLIIRAGCANPGTRVVPPCTENCGEAGKDANTGFSRDWEEEHAVNDNDGATDPQGLQEDPVADAEAAEQAAEEEAAAQQEAHQDAVEDAPVVNEQIPAGPVVLD